MMIPYSPIKQTLEDFYLDWVNNYLTVDCFAEAHRITPQQAHTLIDFCRVMFNPPVVVKIDNTDSTHA